MNEEVLYNKYYEKFKDFTDAVLGFLEGLFNPPIELAKKVTKRVTDAFRAIGKMSSMEKAGASL